MSVVSDLQRRLGGRRIRRIPNRPHHIGVIIDGNRRWAKTAGYTSPSVGHRYGAEHVRDFLTWAQEADIEHVTVYIVSADNLRNRDVEEVEGLHDILRTTLPEIINESLSWRLHLSGNTSLLPGDVTEALDTARDRTLGRPRHVTLAIGYDGRQDIVNAVRAALLRDSDSAAMAALTVERVTEALDGGPHKDIDLVIRTSGEQRLSGFCPWQTEHAEFFVSPKMWPAFAKRDFLAALQHYAAAKERNWDDP